MLLLLVLIQNLSRPFLWKSRIRRFKDRTNPIKLFSPGKEEVGGREGLKKKLEEILWRCATIDVCGIIHKKESTTQLSCELISHRLLV
jgi:hypothetical protein